ncbi:MAG: O-sialoglycoprotein endopeptidase [Clostridiales bacterium]|nr:O-sialoglycoprotein endopeptidase [Clostridiales bacterium]
MKETNDFIMAIDTSNYTTSIAIVDCNQNIIKDERKTLRVKQGERGLRQSHALFQHLENLPLLIENAFSDIDTKSIKAIAVSDRPRPVKDSYMPVFKAGLTIGSVIASSLSVPLYKFSHQEGHLAAVSYGTQFKLRDSYLAFHLSGGTCELLYVDGNSVEKVGGSKDISFGQVIDRIGVALGMFFPAGNEMDKLAFNFEGVSILKRIPFDGLEINLSGLETQAQRLLANNNKEQLAYSIFYEISYCLVEWINKAVNKMNCNRVLLTGGVAASEFIRKHLNNYYKDKEVTIEFGPSSLSTDNAVGLALLGGAKLWQ